MNDTPSGPRRSFVLRLSVVTACLALAGGLAQAQTWPTRTVTLVTGAPPGGGTDAITRGLAEALASRVKQPVVVENRPGAGGSIAAQHVARSPADGLTLLLAPSGLALEPAMVKNLPYSPTKDLEGVARIADATTILVAGTHTGVHDLKELRALGQKNPQALTFGVPEPSLRLDSENVGAALGVPVTIVNYKGTSNTMTDVAGGHVGFAITSVAAAKPFLESGKVVPLAAIGLHRSPRLPQVPTFSELGYKGLDSGPWFALFAPAGTPKDVIAQINRQVNDALKDPKMLERLKAVGIDAAGGGADEFDSFFHAEVKRLGEAAKKAGIQPQ